MSINTYLMFNGNCEEAFKFYEKVLGGKIQDMLRMPARRPSRSSRPNGRTRSCMRGSWSATRS